MRPERTMQLEGPKMTDDPIRQADIERRARKMRRKHPAAVPERGPVRRAGKQL